MTAVAGDKFAATRARSGPTAIASWMLFDWAAQPFYTLIATFIFAPYFVKHVIGDPVHGQAVWGYTEGAAAILIAIGSPILGAMADARGRLKPYMAILSVFFVAAQAALWYALPGTPHVWFVILAVMVATMAAEYSSVLNNSLMPRIVAREQLGRISGAGWAVGYFGGLVSIALMAAFVLEDPMSGKTLLGLKPLFHLGDAAHASERIAGPLSALWFVLFVAPFFLFTPDASPAPAARTPSLREVLATLGDTLRHIRAYRNIVLFILARMAFVDGLFAIFQFGGIYAVAVFGWQVSTLGLFGIILTLSGGIGALIGGFIDDRIGAKKVIIGALAILVIGALGVISIDKGHVLFWLEAVPRAEGASLFASTGERFFVAFAILIGLTSGPLQAASRSLLARMAPPEQMSEFYGFFAFSGKATAFAAPILIGVITTVSGSQRIGMSAILVFLAAGFVLMSLVDTRAVER